MFLISEDILLWNGQLTFLNFTFAIMHVGHSFLKFSRHSAIGGGVWFKSKGIFSATIKFLRIVEKSALHSIRRHNCSVRSISRCRIFETCSLHVQDINSRSRKRNITWYNPPFSKNVATNVGQAFLKILDEEFQAGHGHILHKIFNRNTVKISYSCTSNFKQNIDAHNKSKLSHILVLRVFLGKTLVSAGHVTLQKLIAQGGVAKYQITCFHRKR
jgi:hypothetical protein